jgi:hypothetical protein
MLSARGARVVSGVPSPFDAAPGPDQGPPIHDLQP